MTNSAATLAAHELGVQLGSAEILRDIDLHLPQGRVTALVGRNGSGKSTLLRALARVVKLSQGAVLLDGRDLAHMPTREIARRLALLPQGTQAPPGVTVRALVELGRHPHLGRFGRLTTVDREAITWALEVTDSESLADRYVDTLSGGERQRAWLAVALAQRTEVLLLDEPTTYLDVRHQLEVLTLVRQLNRDLGLTVCWVLHDLNAAAEYSDHMVCLGDGEIVAQGAPADLLTTEMVREVFGIEALIVPNPDSGFPVCIPRAASAPPATSAHTPGSS